MLIGKKREMELIKSDAAVTVHLLQITLTGRTLALIPLRFPNSSPISLRNLSRQKSLVYKYPWGDEQSVGLHLRLRQLSIAKNSGCVCKEARVNYEQARINCGCKVACKVAKSVDMGRLSI